MDELLVCFISGGVGDLIPLGAIFQARPRVAWKFPADPSARHGRRTRAAAPLAMPDIPPDAVTQINSHFSTENQHAIKKILRASVTCKTASALLIRIHDGFLNVEYVSLYINSHQSWEFLYNTSISISLSTNIILWLCYLIFDFIHFTALSDGIHWYYKYAFVSTSVSVVHMNDMW